jgi:hypothetical protein
VEGSGDIFLVEFALRCEFAHCGEIHDSRKKLLDHYKVSHKKEQKPCPFEGCFTSVEAFSSLLWHIRKKHEGQDHSLKKEILCRPVPSFEFPASQDELTEHNTFAQENVSEIDGPSFSSEDDEDDERTNDSILPTGISPEQATSFERGYADFLNRLMSFHFIPLTAIVKINTEIAALVDIATQTRDNVFVGALQDHNISDTVTESIMNSIRKQEDIVKGTFKYFQTPKKAESYLMENFTCIKPRTVKLGEGSFQYISIIDTLKAVTRDKTFQKFGKTCVSKDNGDLLSDIEDGLSYKESQFFRINPRALK